MSLSGNKLVSPIICNKRNLFVLNCIRRERGDFLGGTVVKNPSASAGDMGSSPGLGRSHMPCSN